MSECHELVRSQITKPECVFHCVLSCHWIVKRDGNVEASPYAEQIVVRSRNNRMSRVRHQVGWFKAEQ